MKQITYLLLLILPGISNPIQACHSISDSLIGHWFVAEKNISYSSEESDNDNYHEEIIRHFIFNEDSTGYWLVETVKKHTDGKSD